MSQSRRDFIRTVIVSSGAVFLSCKDLLAAPDVSSKTVTTESLHFSQAHQLLREGGALPNFPYHALAIETVIIGGGTAGMAAARLSIYRQVIIF
jgi:hypothetical protein